mmetsp:Transcript_24083/g.48033  ORF Transcript_24083/g.48033 Transcript_24083/m.48033 type:complete len:236 (-) Transcript_24083:186-893(-)
MISGPATAATIAIASSLTPNTASRSIYTAAVSQPITLASTSRTDAQLGSGPATRQIPMRRRQNIPMTRQIIPLNTLQIIGDGQLRLQFPRCRIGREMRSHAGERTRQIRGMSRRTQIDDFVTSLALVVLGVGANSMLEFVTLTSIPRISTTEGDAGGTGFGFGGGLTTSAGEAGGGSLGAIDAGAAGGCGGRGVEFAWVTFDGFGGFGLGGGEGALDGAGEARAGFCVGGGVFFG